LGSRACEGKILKCRLLFDDVAFARASSTGTQNRIRILWTPVGSSKVLQAAGCELQAARLHPRLKDIQHHLVGVVGRATSRETPGEVDMETCPAPGSRNRILSTSPGVSREVARPTTPTRLCWIHLRCGMHANLFCFGSTREPLICELG